MANSIKIGGFSFDALKIGGSDVDAAYLGDTLVYSGGTPTHDYSQDYLTFVAEEDGTFSFNSSGMSYSLDSGSTWTSLASDTDTPTVSAGSKILWKATLTSNGIGKFTSSGNFTVEGNAMSLLFGDNFIGQTSLSGKDYAFSSLFNGCTTITSAENLVLPATTLAEGCYSDMFNGCTNLTTAPSLPATTLATYCYADMFFGCTSLTTAPSLPATTLARNCYQYMFRDCRKLTTAPQLPATTLGEWCYYGMFQGCTSLTTAPSLPATTLPSGCYNGMFLFCTSLNSITCLAIDISASICTLNWVSLVASSGTFTKAASMSSWTEGDDGIPSGWTVVDYQPTPPEPSYTYVPMDADFDTSTPVYGAIMSWVDNEENEIPFDFWGDQEASEVPYYGSFTYDDINDEYTVTIWDNASTEIYQETFSSEPITLDFIEIVGQPVYFTVPSVFVCFNKDCIDYDEETGECLEEECIEDGDVFFATAKIIQQN